MALAVSGAVRILPQDPVPYPPALCSGRTNRHPDLGDCVMHADCFPREAGLVLAAEKEGHGLEQAEISMHMLARLQ